MNYSSEIIDFFKRHNLYEEKMFNYLQENSIMIDYRVEEHRAFVGCFCQYEKNSNILLKFNLCIPFDYNDVTRLVCIHEIVHGICAYKKLNKHFDLGNSCEVLPFLYEGLYVIEKQSEELNNYLKYLDSCIEEHSDEKYKIALYLRNELLDNYEDNFDKMDRLSKRLTLRYSLFHR